MKKNLTIIIIMVLILSAFPIHSSASNISELEQKQNEINTQIEQKNEELTDIQNEISSVMQEIQNLTEEIESYEKEIQNLNSQTEELKGSIEELEKELIVSQTKYEKQKKTLEDRLVILYEAGETNYLDVLLNSKSLSDFLSSYYYISEIVKHDKELLEDLENDKNKIELSKKTLDEQREKLKSIKNSKERTAIVLENTKILQNNYKKQLTEEEKTLQAEIETYESQVKEIEAEILLITTANLDSDYTGGIMEWPVPGYTRITSEFGMRLHPTLHVYKLHTGIDIGAPMRANFIAVSDGVVIKAGYNSAYGNMVIIDHGGGISTLYAHGDEILVTVGQTVKRGEVILKVGSTGYSTGPHAHFEVRVNGEYVQPLNFLKKSE